MAIKRQKLNRKVHLVTDGDNVIDMPPGWQFTIDCPHYGAVTLDFSPYRANNRDNLASHIRDAFWSMRHESVGASLAGIERNLRLFLRFLESLRAAGTLVTDLHQVDRMLIDRFLAWLELQTASTGKNKGRPLSVAAKLTSLAALKTVLVNRQKLVPALISPSLDFPHNPFPNSRRLIPKRESYSVGEQKRIVAALNMDLRSIHDGEGAALTPLQILTVHLLLLALATGRNLQSLIDLRRDSLREHPIPDRELLVTTKRRGWSTHATSLRKASAVPEQHDSIQTIPASVGDHFRFLCEYTAPLIEEVAAKDKDFVFLWRVPKGPRKGQAARIMAQDAKAVRAFALRHNLLDDAGAPLVLNVARLRPTFATELYQRTRDVRRVQQALGHANVSTTARHYADAPIEAERDHAMVIDAMVSTFSRMEIDGKVLLAADGKIPLQDVQDLLTGGYNTGIARCRNPFREDDSVCKKFFACFKCPSMCVFEDDLWRLFSFYYRLLSERSKINPAQWLKTYGPIIRRIDADIASQFPADKVAVARVKAKETPHPAWKGPLL